MLNEHLTSLIKSPFLVHNKTFRPPPNAEHSFELFKELKNAVLVTIYPNEPLLVGTDAYDMTITPTTPTCEMFSGSSSPSNKH